MFVLGKFLQRIYKLDQKYITKGFFFKGVNTRFFLLWFGVGGCWTCPQAPAVST